MKINIFNDYFKQIEKMRNEESWSVSESGKRYKLKYIWRKKQKTIEENKEYYNEVIIDLNIYIEDSQSDAINLIVYPEDFKDDYMLRLMGRKSFTLNDFDEVFIKIFRDDRFNLNNSFCSY